MRPCVSFYLNQFLFNFARCVPLVLALLFVFAVVFVPGVNQSYGMSHLIWHEDKLKQAAVGFALGVVVVQVLAAAYLIESKQTPPDQRPNIPALGPALTNGVGLLLSTAVTLSPVILSVADEWGPMLTGWPLALGFMTALAVYFVGVRFLVGERAENCQMARIGHTIFDTLSHVRLLRVPKAHPADMPLHGVAVLALVFSGVVYGVVGLSATRLFSPLVGVVALLGAGVAGYGFMKYFLDRLQPGMVLGLLGLVYLGGLNRYQMRYADVESRYDRPAVLAEYEPQADAPLLKPGEVQFCADARGPYAEGQKRPLVVVCVSGGGIRAAGWSTAVLHRLEEEFSKEGIDFPCHVRLITGASGGMVGAAYYVADLPDPPPTPLRRTDLRERYEAITDDCLSPIIHSLAYTDLRATFSPFGRRADRGQALEAAWRKHLRGALDLTFVRLAAGERAGWRPSLAFSPMLVEDGRRLLVSNLDLAGVVSNDGSILQEYRDEQADPSLPLRKHLNRFSFESIEFFRLFRDSATRRHFRVATAARMSASFPFVSPAGVLPTEPRRRVVDAGYYDNDGVSLAGSWLFSGANRDWLKKHASKIVLIQIRDGVSEPSRKLRAIKPDGSSALTRGAEFFLTPAEGLFNARVGSSSFRNDALLELLSQQLIAEMQVRPLLDELTKKERDILVEAKAQTLIRRVKAGLDDEDTLHLRHELEEQQYRNAPTPRREKLQRYARLMDRTPVDHSARARWSRMMGTATRFDARPAEVVERLIREPEFQAASVEFTPALEAALKTEMTRRFAGNAVQADALLERVRRTFDMDAGNPFFVTVAFEYGGEASLSWYLTRGEKDDILAQTDRLEPRIRQLIDWWKQPSSQDGRAD